MQLTRLATVSLQTQPDIRRFLCRERFKTQLWGAFQSTDVRVLGPADLLLHYREHSIRVCIGMKAVGYEGLTKNKHLASLRQPALKIPVVYRIVGLSKALGGTQSIRPCEHCGSEQAAVLERIVDPDLPGRHV